MSNQKQFNSKAEATRFYIIETLKSLEEGRYMSKKELSSRVNKHLAEDGFGPSNEQSFSQTLKLLGQAEGTPVLKNPLARGLYGFDHEITFDISNLKTQKSKSQNNQNKNLKLDNKILNILNGAKKDITKLIDDEQVPLSVLLDEESEELNKYKAKIRLVKDASGGIDDIIEIVTGNEKE